VTEGGGGELVRTSSVVRHSHQGVADLIPHAAAQHGHAWHRHATNDNVCRDTVVRAERARGKAGSSYHRTRS
jgi:hypothetical protein